MKVIENERIAPRARKVPVELEKHGDIRIDNYFWLRERENPEVLDYLTQENLYNEQMTAHTKELQENLFQEVKGRIKEDDSSVPYKLNGYWYITRFEKGKDYPIYSRKKESLDAPEEILFDVNKMAKGHDYYKLSGLSVSPNNKLISYAVDTVSRRKYTLYIKNLETGEVYSEKIRNTTGGATWANDNKTLFYARKDEETLRSNKIFKHRLGTKAKDDELVYLEEDETFHTYVYNSKSKRYIIIGSDSTLTSEYRVLSADDPHGEFKVIQPRIRGLEYSIAHYRECFYILTNKDGATNFKLMKAPVYNPSIENWEEVIPHREEVLLEDIDLFRDYLVVSERSNGLNKIHIRRWDGTDSYFLPFENETYTAFTGTNPDFDTEILRYTYNSLITPTQVVDFNMRTREKDVKKELEVLGGKFKKENYVSDRIWATAQDGTKIPMTLVHRKELKRDGTNPVLQYAYGSYGSTIDPYFSNVRLSLLDRGFIFVIAHVRGGEYLGRQWYEDGKLLKKKNTFTDFIDCTLHLIKENYTSADHMYASGGSAGGLLMGVVANMAPQLYKGIIASVPFVDVVTTMLDETIPLTTGEYDEWGNPNDPVFYHYMKSYSPYDNVVAQDYPNMLVTTGLHDSQVQYWEPAKWVAKLRELKTDNNILLFHTNMDAGHGGASGRFEALREVAEEYAFLLDLEGIHE
ncbi:oligopeptidase B [Salinimicrobium sediminis]|uniref:Proline-specific endopeptidase n=1 Tax=Salinimicrobium sediminis TaxID=1343891 RepID=A0A285X751_9FLAO|nr:S9 family peptidase [Salinimicrobium sediminis]SOC81163.1 oligopeptidase B [Salinimicrobium sediminis]